MIGESTEMAYAKKTAYTCAMRPKSPYVARPGRVARREWAFSRARLPSIGGNGKKAAPATCVTTMVYDNAAAISENRPPGRTKARRENPHPHPMRTPRGDATPTGRITVAIYEGLTLAPHSGTFVSVSCSARGHADAARGARGQSGSLPRTHAAGAALLTPEL